MSRRSMLKLPLVLVMTQTNLNELPANLPRPTDVPFEVLSDEHFALIMIAWLKKHPLRG